MAAKRQHQQRYLPMEITETILLRLPPKSLLRFQTLSKSYMAMIRDPCFSRTHLELSRKNNNSNSFLIMSPKDERYYCLAKYEDRNFRPEKEVRRLPVGSRYTPLCRCDDNILVGRMMKRRIRNVEYLLWNPINNTHRAIRSPPTDRRPLTYGLCHDKTEDDYKIVLVFCVKTYAVYSCKHGTWKAGKRAEDEHRLRFSFSSAGSGVFIDGKLYWVGYEGDRKWGVINFDPLSDSFNELKIPQEDFELRPFLIDLRGIVCVGGDVRFKDVIPIWMLRGGSWEKIVCIDKMSSDERVCHHMCYGIGDEIVICTSDRSYVINILEDRPVWCSKARPKIFPQPLVLSLRSFLT